MAEINTEPKFYPPSISRLLRSEPFSWRPPEVDCCTLLADFAVTALVSEADLTPKPALVDQRGSGAHHDLSLSLLRRSAFSLENHFVQMASVSIGRFPSQSLREELGAIGRSAEKSMLQVTNGINSHRGAIWALGLLVSGAAMNCNRSPDAIAQRAAALARLRDACAPIGYSHGQEVAKRYSVSGARGEACAGFPHVILLGLPAIRRSRWNKESDSQAGLNALLAIMSSLDDTCLLHRGGPTALRAAHRGAAEVIKAGGVSTPEGWQRLLELDRKLLELNASPGGSADLLAATFFLDLVENVNVPH